MKRRIRDLSWGPFAVGAIVASLLGWGLGLLVDLAAGHWWVWPLRVLVLLLFVFVFSSAVGVLLRKRD